MHVTTLYITHVSAVQYTDAASSWRHTGSETFQAAREIKAASHACMLHWYKHTEYLRS